MARRVFYSFHYEADVWRVAKVRKIGMIEENAPATDNDWETVTKGGDKAIQKWIDGQMYGRSCAIVLIGAHTAGRKWINYEIRKAWDDEKGVLGVYIHNIEDRNGDQCTKGKNPFEDFCFGEKNLSSIVKAYNPPQTTSVGVYNYIKENLAAWIEKAIEIRKDN